MHASLEKYILGFSLSKALPCLSFRVSISGGRSTSGFWRLFSFFLFLKIYPKKHD